MNITALAKTKEMPVISRVLRNKNRKRRMLDRHGGVLVQEICLTGTSRPSIKQIQTSKQKFIQV